MTTPIRFHQTTTATPEQYIDGLTDFGPGRAQLFGNSADDYLEVHSMGTTEADVTEGFGRRLGSASRTTAPTRPRSPSRRRPRPCGAAPRATPTRSRATPTARPTSTT